MPHHIDGTFKAAVDITMKNLLMVKVELKLEGRMRDFSNNRLTHGHGVEKITRYVASIEWLNGDASAGSIGLVCSPDQVTQIDLTGLGIVAEQSPAMTWICGTSKASAVPKAFRKPCRNSVCRPSKAARPAHRQPSHQPAH